MTVAEELIQEGRELERHQARTAVQELVEQERRQAVIAAQELVHQNKVKFIHAMLKLNLDATTIASASELPLAEVNIIIDEINRTHTP